ncbi:hypothetical protein LX15_005091 [Streptoalloteichus tenebrarius]|uniref:Uncharacterized protein n=1 Tax=Streptoalloteichus tenebrarius (strain ATCC 17920 / DSM 40477 / JCM 4838 / CBS 697.72 / NBRC 16177 / NCIMB 11028 / NRRL B-12390 / A12253. 1 / ISP 5477) TaxID=1933 RepID=A0ABT1I0Q7_STRSD|nr:hypothetical protein [Streptoalloteichus tenebrarius]MCP2261367.1 hypothetical protein [Streptoalloteichus tenebrarius]
MPSRFAFSDPNTVLLCDQDEIALLSAGQSHQAHLRAEVWDGPPPPPPPDAEVEQGVVGFTDPHLQPYSLEPVPAELDLGEPGLYHVRAERTGSRDLVARLHAPGREGMVEGAERFIVRFWPAAPEAQPTQSTLRKLSEQEQAMDAVWAFARQFPPS